MFWGCVWLPCLRWIFWFSLFWQGLPICAMFLVVLDFKHHLFGVFQMRGPNPTGSGLPFATCRLTDPFRQRKACQRGPTKGTSNGSPVSPIGNHANLDWCWGFERLSLTQTTHNLRVSLQSFSLVDIILLCLSREWPRMLGMNLGLPLKVTPFLIPCLSHRS